MKNVCVFAGSNYGTDTAYRVVAEDLGRTLAGRAIGIVYGGAKVGLMGAMADAALAAGGKVVGVIPEALMAKEVGHLGLTTLHLVETMHDRKSMMATLSDGFIALPGGWGTLEEFFEVLTWGQLGIHRKPCGLLNVNGYFDGLLAFIDETVRRGFVKEDYLKMIAVETTPAALLDRLSIYQPPEVAKWMVTS